MTTRRDRQFVKVQLQEMQRLKQVTAGHPLMSHALAVREKELVEQLQLALDQLKHGVTPDQDKIRAIREQIKQTPAAQR